ncbi:hypothetical protein [Jeongeupia chitinilytica]|uniref:GTPase n=1 Tax=Jeongeupia chitinilytica TaxID=1041641 RepID=A0ABQ3H2Z3_9NEIS|nr:hypothetical protein [Jeongeupia chitinilytica]GHD66888.1 hypothetical protein GCM10007350_29780 [Jeongeupia chitinilytica]
MLTLALPDFDPRLDAIVERQPAKLREWLIQLPMSQVLDAGRQVLDSLASSNRVRIAPDERYALLEQYGTAIGLLAGGLETLYRVPGLPLGERARQAAQLMRALWQELATGYKRTLIDKLEKRSLFGGQRLAAQAIQQTMHAHYQQLRLASRIYMSTPTGFWRESHQLFRYAGEHKLLEEGKDEQPHTSSLLYKRMLLLALADPLRYAQDELDKVLELVENYAPLIRFQSPSRLGAAAGFFLVRLDQDQPPRYVGARNTDGIDGAALLVDTIELGKKLFRALHALEAKAPQAHDRAKVLMWMEILRRVNRQWSIAPTRLFQRILADTRIELCLGLAATVHTTSAGQIGTAAASPTFSQWRIVNESPGGYAVRSDAMQPELARAGEIVALRASADEPWMIASVRWLQQRDDGGIDMGLQVMSAQPTPAMVRTAGPRDAAPAQPALLIPEIAVLKQAAQLAASKGTYAPLRELAVDTGAGVLRLRATKLVEQQMGYDLFEYQPG